MYDQLQHGNSVKLLEKTIRTCLEKANELKMQTVSFAIAPAQCKAWPLGLYESIKIRSNVDKIKCLKNVDLVRLVSEDQVATNYAKDILDQM